MLTDHYTKVLLTVIAAALIVIALNPWVTPQQWLRVISSHQAEAQNCPGVVKARIPSTYGKLAGTIFTQDTPGFVFDGTDAIRMVNTKPLLANLESGSANCSVIVFKKA